jgi:biopolymer transport protein ExbD
MAVSVTPAPGGKRPLDAELNLVPFIDLLVCCICFLLITAVWVQLSSVRVHSGGGRGEGAVDPVQVSVLVGSDGYTLNVGAERLALPKRGNLYDDAALSEKLRHLYERVGAKPLTVAAEDGISFRHVVRAMDLAHGASFAEITVSDGHHLL